MSVISQGISVSYNAVVNANKKAANQWADSSFLTELERQGGIKHIAFGETLEVSLDCFWLVNGSRTHGVTFCVTPAELLMDWELTTHDLIRQEWMKSTENPF